MDDTDPVSVARPLQTDNTMKHPTRSAPSSAVRLVQITLTCLAMVGLSACLDVDGTPRCIGNIARYGNSLATGADERNCEDDNMVCVERADGPECVSPSLTDCLALFNGCCEGDVVHTSAALGGQATDCSERNQVCAYRYGEAACVHPSLMGCTSNSNRCSYDGTLLSICNERVSFVDSYRDCAVEGLTCVDNDCR